MPEFLELTVDKFTFRTATDRHYNSEGVWALAEGNRVRIGQTCRRAQNRLEDRVAVDRVDADLVGQIEQATLTPTDQHSVGAVP